MSTTTTSAALAADDATTRPSSPPSQQQQQQPVRMTKRRPTVANTTTDLTRRMICGGLAGMIAKTATNPLERIKMLSQTGEHGGARGSLDLFRSIINNEGWRGLWAGNGVNLLRIFPAKAVVFSSNDVYRSLLLRQYQRYQQRRYGAAAVSGSLPPALGFLAGGLAGMTASAATYPLDLARGRISGKLAGSSSGTSNKMYTGIWQTLALTVKDEGWRALYKGVTPTLLGAMPYEGIKFGTVALLEQWFPQDQKTHHPVRKMILGGLGGVMAGLLTYPNDTVRRLLQLQGSRGTVNPSTGQPTTQPLGYWEMVRVTYQQHGFRRFYSGLTVNLVRMAPNAAVQFGSYELLKQWSSSLSTW